MSVVLQNALNHLSQAIERLDGAVVKNEQFVKGIQSDLFNASTPKNDNGKSANGSKVNAALARTLDRTIERVEQLLKEEA